MRIFAALWDDYRNGWDSSFEKNRWREEDEIYIFLHRDSPAIMPEEQNRFERCPAVVTVNCLSDNDRDDYSLAAFLAISEMLRDYKQPELYLVGPGMKDIYDTKISSLVKQTRSVSYAETFRVGKAKKVTKKDYRRMADDRRYKQLTIDATEMFDSLVDAMTTDPEDDSKPEKENRKPPEETEPEPSSESDVEKEGAGAVESNDDKAEMRSSEQEPNNHDASSQDVSENNASVTTGNGKRDPPESMEEIEQAVFAKKPEEAKPIKRDDKKVLEDAKAIVARELMKRFKKRFEPAVISIKKNGLSNNELNAVIESLIRADTTDDFSKTVATMEPSMRGVAIKEDKYRVYKAEAMYFYKVCNVLFNDPFRY